MTWLIAIGYALMAMVTCGVVVALLERYDDEGSDDWTAFIPATLAGAVWPLTIGLGGVAIGALWMTRWAQRKFGTAPGGATSGRNG
jgi:hypothetical protein